MDTLQHLNPWLVSYSYSVAPNQRRTQGKGFTRQAKKSNRNVVVASVSRQLRGTEIYYFESFVRDVLKDGSKKFIDSYADANGLVSGTVRIKDGAYSVSSDLLTHTVTCDLEIFR